MPPEQPSAATRKMLEHGARSFGYIDEGTRSSLAATISRSRAVDLADALLPWVLDLSNPRDCESPSN